MNNNNMLDNKDYRCLFGAKNNLLVSQKPGMFRTYREAIKIVFLLLLISAAGWYTMYLGYVLLISWF